MVFIKGNLIGGAEIGLGGAQVKTRGFMEISESEMQQKCDSHMLKLKHVGSRDYLNQRWNKCN